MKTFIRPVPLEHSIFLFKKFQVIRELNGSFLEKEYDNLLNLIESASYEGKEDIRN